MLNDDTNGNATNHTNQDGLRRLAWRVNHDLSVYSGLSIPFWRKLIASKGIPVTKVGKATLIMDSDVRNLLSQRAGLHEVRPLSEDEKARRNEKRRAAKQSRNGQAVAA